MTASYKYRHPDMQTLVEENARLRREVEFLRGHPSIAKGIKGETLISTLLQARRSRRGAAHDLEAKRGHVLLEVKYSSLLRTYSARAGHRWVWTKLFGEMGNKQYDRLLLVGDADPTFQEAYLEPDAPYVLFDVPYQDALDLANGAQPGRRSRLHLTTNPASVLSWRSKALFETFQVSSLELSSRYGT